MEYVFALVLIAVGLGAGFAFRQYRRAARTEPFKTQLEDSRK